MTLSRFQMVKITSKSHRGTLRNIERKFKELSNRMVEMANSDSPMDMVEYDKISKGMGYCLQVSHGLCALYGMRQHIWMDKYLQE